MSQVSADDAVADFEALHAKGEVDLACYEWVAIGYFMGRGFVANDEAYVLTSRWLKLRPKLTSEVAHDIAKLAKKKNKP